MPAEFTSLTRAIRVDRFREARRRKRQRAVDPRRVEISTCDYLLDKKKNGDSRFTNNVCCKSRSCMSKYSPNDVLVLRHSLLSRPRNTVDRRVFISSRYNPRSTVQSRGSGAYHCDSPDYCRLASVASLETPLPLHPRSQNEVCASFFHWAYAVSNDSSRKCLASRLEYPKRFKGSEAPKQWVVEKWLLDVSQYYQQQPDSDIILLPFANRASVYELFTIEEDTTVCQKYFLRIWRTSQKTQHIRLRKHLRFTKCDTCVGLRERKTHTMDRKILQQVRDEEYAHYQFVKEERGNYYLRRTMAVKKPADHLSLIIDGADWYNYALPYWATKTHASDRLYRAPIYLIGVISHGRGTKCFVVPGHFRQGTNVILDVLIRTLKAMKARGEDIPRKIYIQLDNTCKQNKNHYMLGVLGYLVMSGVTDKIIVSFLPVGHTHEDIDQLFSRLVIALMCRDARSVSELTAIIRTAYTDKNGRATETEELTAVANLSDWIKDYINDFHGLTRFRQFVIKKNQQRDVIVRARTNTTDSKWQGIEAKTDSTKVFKTRPPSIIPDLPPCQRRPLPSDDEQKSYKASLARVCSQLCSLRKYFVY